jgi:hypothetical protein
MNRTVKPINRRNIYSPPVQTKLTQTVYIAQTLPSETSEADDSNQLLKSPPSASLFHCFSHIMSHGGRINQGE